MAACLLVLVVAFGFVGGLEIGPVLPQGSSSEDPAREDQLRRFGAAKPAQRGRTSTCDIRSGGRRLADCKICRLVQEGHQVPTLYAKGRDDGCGARLHDIIMWLSIAARNHMKFGGVISRGTCRESHGADIFRAVGEVLGLGVPEDMFLERAPPFDIEYKGVHHFHRRFVDGWWKQREYNSSANVFVGDKCVACALQPLEQSTFLTHRFLTKLRGSSKLLGRSVPRMTPQYVALHVRRGDVVAGGRDDHRLTSDAWYFGVVKHIRSVLPNADVHVFSSTEGKYSSEDFEAFGQRGMTVHLDGDILDAWAALAQAKIVVMAKSSFSHVPAMLNLNCVIYQPYWHKPLDNWIVALDEGEQAAHPEQPLFNASKLRSCLDQPPGARGGGARPAPKRRPKAGTGAK